MPNPAVATSETGTRHRTAERVARSIDVPVITVSEDRSVISVYRGEQQRPLVPVERLLARANQALETLEGYRDRLDVVTNALSALEVEDMVTVRDVVTVLQRTEMVRRIAEEVDGYSIELGTDSRLVRLQLEEMLAGVEEERRQILRDYLPPDPAWDVARGSGALSQLSTERLLDLSRVASVLRIGGPGSDLESPLRPYGYRLAVQDPPPARAGGPQHRGPLWRAPADPAGQRRRPGHRGGHRSGRRPLRQRGPGPAGRNEHPGPPGLTLRIAAPRSGNRVRRCQPVLSVGAAGQALSERARSGAAGSGSGSGGPSGRSSRAG